jgi:predicted 3-demethylubiquinone-9 3-methyltransferase (glyoxalase superfamily)
VIEMGIVPNLWFDDKSEEAAKFYVDVFSNRKGAANRPESKITAVTHYPEGAPRPAGMVLTVEFEIEGQRFTAINGGPEFTFDEAVSFLIECEDQEEIDELWEKLPAGGGETNVCGWLKDKYGLAWQVVPKGMDEMFSRSDKDGVKRAFDAMMGMKKIEVAELERAYEGT